jgi:hypothetical protein
MEAPVDVTIAPPDVTIPSANGNRVNLYLYQVSENATLKNQEICGGYGADFGRPPLSLDLHYLLTAYAGQETTEDADLRAQEILGDAMRVLHDFAVVGPHLREGDVPAAPRILDPLLVGECETIKITLQPATVEEFSKLWTVLPETSFRRSVHYQVSVVQIESRRSRTTALPVRERAVTALPFRRAQIHEVFRQPPVENVRVPVAEAGETLRIAGMNLAGEMTVVVLGGVEVPVAAPQRQQIDVAVPSALAAGVHLIEVVHDVPLGPGGAPHRLFHSNAVPFQVIPRIDPPLPAPASAGSTITVTIQPAVRATQEVALLLGDFVLPAEPVAPDSAPSTSRQFRLPDGPAPIPPGDYLMRVRVNSAESRLITDAMTGEYTGPIFTVNP